MCDTWRPRKHTAAQGPAYQIYKHLWELTNCSSSSLSSSPTSCTCQKRARPPVRRSLERGRLQPAVTLTSDWPLGSPNISSPISPNSSCSRCKKAAAGSSSSLSSPGSIALWSSTQPREKFRRSPVVSNEEVGVTGEGGNPAENFLSGV